MDDLPDDVLIAVLQLLPLEEVMRARRVCRRWSRLALHPDLWRHQCLVDFCLPSLMAALHLTPCAEKLSIWGGLDKCGAVVTRTACAAAELELAAFTRGDSVLAAIVIRNQASLGHLRKLTVILREEAAGALGVVDLFDEIHRLEGLTKLDVILNGTADLRFPAEASAIVPKEAVAPSSLRECRFWATSNAFLLRPHWEFQLRSHAATLRKVKLQGVTWPPGGLQASLFNAMPHLEELQCPLLEDMHLLQCARLWKLKLYPGFEEADIDARVNVAVDYAKVFFGRARDLVQLDLRGWQGVGGLAAGLVSASASSGRSKLEALCLSPDAAAATPRQLHLASLPALREVRFKAFSVDSSEAVPDAFLDLLALESVPGLTLLEGDAEGCLHAWLQRAVLQDVFRKNPQLHVVTYGSCCDEGAVCASCLAGDCAERGLRRWDHHYGVCGHSPEADGNCVLSEKHAHGSLFAAWFHMPSDEEVV